MAEDRTVKEINGRESKRLCVELDPLPNDRCACCRDGQLEEACMRVLLLQLHSACVGSVAKMPTRRAPLQGWKWVL